MRRRLDGSGRHYILVIVWVAVDIVKVWRFLVATSSEAKQPPFPW